MLFFLVSLLRGVTNAGQRRGMDNLTTVEQRQIHEILSDFFQHRIRERNHQWTPPIESEASPENARICATLLNLSQSFYNETRGDLQRLVERVTANENLQPPVLENGYYATLNELMTAQGINWERIVVAFTFAIEVALRVPSQDRITTIYNWTATFIARTLVPWLRDNGGWASILGEPGQPEGRPRSNYYRNIFGVAGIAIGAIAIGTIYVNNKS